MFCAWALFVIFTCIQELAGRRHAKCKELRGKLWNTTFCLAESPQSIGKRKYGRLPEFSEGIVQDGGTCRMPPALTLQRKNNKSAEALCKICRTRENHYDTIKQR